MIFFPPVAGLNLDSCLHTPDNAARHHRIDNEQLLRPPLHPGRICDAPKWTFRLPDRTKVLVVVRVENVRATFSAGARPRKLMILNDEVAVVQPHPVAICPDQPLPRRDPIARCFVKDLSYRAHPLEGRRHMHRKRRSDGGQWQTGTSRLGTRSLPVWTTW